jgi:hypothetical protein
MISSISLIPPPDLKELDAILTKMRRNVAPGLDGLNTAFYKAS